MRSRPTWAALAGCALVASCVYTFDNPVASLPAGSLTGRLALQGAAAGQSLDGGTIKIAWSGLTVPLQPSGFFGFLNLPDGTYTLVYQIPPAGEGDPPFIGILRDVVIPAASGAADAVDLGTIQVAPAGTVAGTVVGGQDPMVVAFFNATDGGGEVFEGFHTTTADGGQFQLTIPAGSHILVASSATLSAETPFTLGSLQTLELPPLTLQVPPNDGGAGMAGNLSFGVGASASTDVVGSLTQGMGASDFPPLCGPMNAQAQIPQVGCPFVQAVRPGRPYDFVATLAPAQAATDGVYDPLSIKQLPVLAGHPTNLGPVPWFPRPVFAANDGGESSPVWGSVEGSPASGMPSMSASSSGGCPGMCDGAREDGGECPDNGQYGGAVQKLLVLPLGLDEASHLLVWTDTSGAIWSTDDTEQDGGFGQAIETASYAVPSSLAGASDGDGGVVIAWVVQDGGGVRIGSAYQSPGEWAVRCPIAATGEAVAVATGGAVVFTTSRDGLRLLPDPASTIPEIPATKGLFAGVTALALTPCQTDLPDGLCLAWTDSANGLNVAVLDPAATPDPGFLVADAGSLLASSAQNPSVAAFIDPVLHTPYVVVSWLDGSGDLWWGYLPTLLDSTQWVSQQVPNVISAGPALLLPWQGVPLAVYEPGPNTMASSTLPPGVVPSPIFPGHAASQYPSGYAGPNGALDLGLIDPDGGPALFQLQP